MTTRQDRCAICKKEGGKLVEFAGGLYHQPCLTRLRLLSHGVFPVDAKIKRELRQALVRRQIKEKGE